MSGAGPGTRPRSSQSWCGPAASFARSSSWRRWPSGPPRTSRASATPRPTCARATAPPRRAKNGMRSRSTPRRPKCLAPLVASLKPGGRLVLPLARGRADLLTAYRRTDDGSSDEVTLEQNVIAECRFWPASRRVGVSLTRQIVSSSVTALLGPQLLLACLHRPAQARPQDRDDQARRQGPQVPGPARSSGSRSAISTRPARRSSLP